jgi:hypothetical protein
LTPSGTTTKTEPGQTNEVDSTAFPTDRPDISKVDQVQRENAEKKQTRTGRVSKEELRKQEEDREKVKRLSNSLQRLATHGMDALVMRMPSPEPLTDFEKEMFGESVNDVLVKWLPLSFKWGEEIALGICLAMILAGRLQKEKKPKKTDEGKLEQVK